MEEEQVLSMSKKLPEKYFIGIIIGLFTVNIFGSVIIPAHFVVDVSQYPSNSILEIYRGFFAITFTHYIFAFMGIFYQFLWLSNLPSSITLSYMVFVLLILSIISIPITIKLSKGIRTYKRIFYAYLIHIEILTLFTWWWIPNFGPS